MPKTTVPIISIKFFFNRNLDSQALNHPLFNWLHVTAPPSDQLDEKRTTKSEPPPPPVANKREQHMLKDIFGITVQERVLKMVNFREFSKKNSALNFHIFAIL